MHVTSGFLVGAVQVQWSLPLQSLRVASESQLLPPPPFQQVGTAGGAIVVEVVDSEAGIIWCGDAQQIERQDG